MIFELSVLIFLVIISIIDIKYKAIPSVVLTGAIFVLAVVNPTSIIFGVYSGLLAFLLYELGEDVNMPFGMADVKVMIILGLMVSTLTNFIFMIGLFAIFQFVYILTIRLKGAKDKELPFIPVFAFTYFSLWMLGGLL